MQYRFIDEAMTDNDELMARKLCVMLEARWPETVVSLTGLCKDLANESNKQKCWHVI